ncbi:hypothetical protein MBLNU13_g08368t2 [Cladosporium sp. NU13]
MMVSVHGKQALNCDLIKVIKLKFLPDLYYLTPCFRPGPALQRILDQGAARPSAAEASANKKVSPSAPASVPIPSFATKVFPQLPYLKTQRSSCLKLLFYSERERAERQADFDRRSYARLEDVERGQKRHERLLKARAKAELPPRSDYFAEARYIDADDSPLTLSQIELIDDVADEVEEEDDGFFLSPSKQMSEKAVSNCHEDEVYSPTGLGSDHLTLTEQQGSLETLEGPTSKGSI